MADQLSMIFLQLLNNIYKIGRIKSFQIEVSSASFAAVAVTSIVLVVS
jgi:hypothetical protein